MKNSEEPLVQQCSCWDEIVAWIKEFPSPETSIDYEFGVATTAWAFRGLRDSAYGLQPAIEREVRDEGMTWSGLEELVSFEFKARARMHLSAPLIPTDEVTWLAQMQHYGIPTRLLDFTYSPFVALYFAIRNSHKELLGCQKEPSRTHIRLWAVNASAVNDRFRRVTGNAVREARRRAGKKEDIKFVPWTMMDFLEYRSDRESVTNETRGLHKRIAEALDANGPLWRDTLDKEGCVCAASPPAFNPRLVSQQGLFLLNCADGREFYDSLLTMMGEESGWGKVLDIPIGLIPEIEDWLFKMNIHEQSLFPDMEGLAGLIRQKLRLHWK